MGVMMGSFSGVRRILIIKLKHIGDVLLSVPTVAAVRAAFPAAEIHYLLNADCAPMVEGHPALAAVIPFQRRRGRLYEINLLWRLRRWRFDMVIDLSGGGDRGAIAAFFSGARHRLGSLPSKKRAVLLPRWLYNHHFAPPNRWSHTVMQDLDKLRSVGLPIDDPAMTLTIPEPARTAARRRLTARGVDPEKPYCVVHPLSRWQFKCIDDRVLAAGIDALADRFSQPVLVTCGPGSGEREKLHRVLALCRSEPVAFIGDLSLKELAAVLAGARLYLGVDSAPSHMAAALAVPSLVLFGPTGAYNWGPWSDGHVNLSNNPERSPYPKKNGRQRAGSHTVLQADWECVPCGKAGCDNSKVSDCLMDISSDAILAEVDDLLVRTREGAAPV